MDVHDASASAGPYAYSDWIYDTRACWMVWKDSSSNGWNLQEWLVWESKESQFQNKWIHPSQMEPMEWKVFVSLFTEWREIGAREWICTHRLSKKSSRMRNAKNLTWGGYLREPWSVRLMKMVRANRQELSGFCWMVVRNSRAWWCRLTWCGSNAMRMAWTTWSISCCIFLTPSCSLSYAMQSDIGSEVVGSCGTLLEQFS